jgi:hypothetical protein
MRHFHAALNKAEVSRIRFHDYASLLIDQGENIKYISTQMGAFKCYRHSECLRSLIKACQSGKRSPLRESRF